MKKGFLVTGGNLFHVNNAEIKAGIIRYTDGHRYLVICKRSNDLVLMANFCTQAKMEFILQDNQSLEQAKGYFEVRLDLGNEADLDYILENIREEECVSRFVDCPEY